MSVDEMLKKIIVDQAQLAADVSNNQLDTQNLEEKPGKLSTAPNSSPQGGLPGNTEQNPKLVNAISTRSGLHLKELDPKTRETSVVGKEI